ncbi:fibrobacter succinogenes major paralogous domain-containing protein [uncultured Fibrobacter sp.]|uniref:fibrobacter succinogenes major paralogous domain-containing protein n=1 Tax=uncultured Fibrobacter sp. TaxID=261512 RepID=UPI0025F005B4|nr:fibrobacter succinogenes major paralogous domain-containing protein [uncultured Fibrobacter sp.]
MRYLQFGLSFAFAASLVACGDDDSESFAYASGRHEVSSYEDLSNCVASKAGTVEYVDTVAYVCAGIDGKNKWVEVSGVEDNPEDFKVCSDVKEGLYAFSPQLKSLYVCKDGAWIPAGDKSSEAESSSSSVKSSGSEASSSSAPQQSGSSAKSSSSSENGGKSSAIESSSSSAKSSSSEVSSSSAPQQSSCSAKSSSSSSEPLSSGNQQDGSEFDPVNNTLKDLRDGQTYKTVQIGDQVWMAENLNYKAENTYCLNNRDTNCSKYGRFYMWGTAMDSAGTWGTNGKGCGYDKPCSPKKSVRGVCPEGWHLPSYFEWKRLIVTVDDSITEYDDENAAATKLKSASGWADGGNGDDSYSFSALPSGYLSYDGYFNFEGKETHFWSSGTQGDMWAFCMVLYSNTDDARLTSVEMNSGASVRCLKD